MLVLTIIGPLARALSMIVYFVAYIDMYRFLERSGQRSPLAPIKSDTLKSLQSIAEKRFVHFLKKAPKDIMATPITLSNDPETVPSLRDRSDAISSVDLKHSEFFFAMHSHSYKGLKAEKLYKNLTALFWSREYSDNDSH